MLAFLVTIQALFKPSERFHSKSSWFTLEIGVPRLAARPGPGCAGRTLAACDDIDPWRLSEAAPKWEANRPEDAVAEIRRSAFRRHLSWLWTTGRLLRLHEPHVTAALVPVAERGPEQTRQCTESSRDPTRPRATVGCELGALPHCHLSDPSTL